MEQKTFDKFIKLLESGKHYTFEELKAQDHGECYHRFANLNNNTHIQLTPINNKMVLLAYHFRDGVYSNIYAVPVNKLEQHTDKDYGYIYRWLFRINDKFEVMDEDTLGTMFFAISFDKDGFLTANKEFKLIDLSKYC